MEAISWVRAGVVALAGLVSVAWGQQVRPYQAPTLVASWGGAPTIDGQLADGEWGDASSYSGFFHNTPLGQEWKDLPLLFPVPSQTTVWLKWDAQKLYIAFRAQRIKGVELNAAAAADQRDKNLTREESVELFFLPREDRHFFFIGNPSGAIFDSANAAANVLKWDSGWNGPWEYKTAVTDEYWQGEAAIAFAGLEAATPSDGQTWPFTVGRNQPGFARSSLSHVGGYFFKPDRYATLLFSRTLKVQASFPQVKLRSGTKLELANISSQPLSVSVAAGVYPLNPEGVQGVKMPDVKGTFAFEEETYRYNPAEGKQQNQPLTLEPGKATTMVMMTPAKPEQRFLSLAEVKTGDRVLFSQILPLLYQEEAPIVVQVEKQILTRSRIRVITKGYSVGSGEVAYELLDAKNQVVQQARVPKSGAKDIVWEIGTPSLTPGQYSVKVTADTGSRTIALTMPELPVWHTQKAGDAATVPPPFKSVAVSGKELSFTYGQKYRFEDSVLPRQVTSLFGQDLLADGVTLTAEVDGKPVRLQGRNLKIEAGRNGDAVLTCRFEGESLGIDARTQVEYDGLTWTQLEVQSARPVSKLFLEIPMRKEAAAWYKLMGPDIVLGTNISRGQIPEQGVTSPFKPCVWIGQIDRGGLEWSCEGDEFWSNRDPKDQIAITPSGHRVVLTVKFIDQPVTLEKPARYGFGLLPTPVRDPRKYNFWKDTPMIYTTSMDDNAVKFISPYAKGGREASFWYLGRNAPRQQKRGVVAVYPLAGNIDGSAGTLEFWVKLDPEKPQPAMDLFYLDLGPDTGLKMEWVADEVMWSERGFTMKLIAVGDTRDTLQSQKIRWNVRDFHHLALTWKKQEQGTLFTLWGDGQQLAQKNLAIDMTQVDWRDKRFFLGGDSQVVFDDLCISRQARSSVTPASPQADADTLLLDRFDEDFLPNDYRQTHAQVISGQSAETGAWVDLWGRFVPGKQGRALKLSVSTVSNNYELSRALGASIFHSHYWHRATFATWWQPQTPQRAQITKQWTQAVRHAGGVASGYYLKNISPEDPYWEDFGNEIVLRPLRPSINNYVLCPNGVGADFLTWTVVKMLEDYPLLDSIHMDYGEVMGCEGIDHGCGWQDAAGKVHKTWPILAHRRMNRRLYSLFHLGPRQNGLYKNHTSSGVILAADGLADYFVTGELEARTPKKDQPIGQWLPEEQYLSFYSWWVTGIPAYGGLLAPWNLLAGDGVPISQSHQLELYPVMDKSGRFNPYREGGDDDIRRTCHLWWPVMSDFFRSGEFVGFWRTADLVKVLPPDAYAKQYVRVSLVRDPAQHRVLAIVGNLGSQAKEVELQLDGTALGLDLARTAAVDAMSREAFPDGQVRVTVNPQNVRLVIFREKPARQ